MPYTGTSGASDAGMFVYPVPPDFTLFNGEMLFAGSDGGGTHGLWETNGTTAGTYELTGITGANAGGLFARLAGYLQPQFTSFNGKVLFDGADSSGFGDLCATNGTASGTHDLTLTCWIRQGAPRSLRSRTGPPAPQAPGRLLRCWPVAPPC